VSRIGAIALGGWLVMVALAAFLPSRPGQSTSFVAMKPLPANHLIHTGDVDVPGITGRYLRAKVEQGKTITAADTMTQPTVKALGAFVTARAPLALVQSRTYEVGQDVRLCQGSTEIASAVKIAALLCDQPVGSQCTAILEPAAGKFPKLPLEAGTEMVAEGGCK
jgi:hypothetical protein